MNLSNISFKSYETWWPSFLPQMAKLFQFNYPLYKKLPKLMEFHIMYDCLTLSSPPWTCKLRGLRHWNLPSSNCFYSSWKILLGFFLELVAALLDPSIDVMPRAEQSILSIISLEDYISTLLYQLFCFNFLPNYSGHGILLFYNRHVRIWHLYWTIYHDFKIPSLILFIYLSRTY